MRLVVLSVLLLVAVVILKVTNAQDPQEVKKAATEAKKEAKPADAKECPGMAAAKTAETKPCCHEKSAEKSADCKAKAEAGKGATAETKAECCKGVTAEAKTEAKPCCAK